jgi:hypothetical protein
VPRPGGRIGQHVDRGPEAGSNGDGVEEVVGRCHAGGEPLHDLRLGGPLPLEDAGGLDGNDISSLDEANRLVDADAHHVGIHRLGADADLAGWPGSTFSPTLKFGPIIVVIAATWYFMLDGEAGAPVHDPSSGSARESSGETAAGVNTNEAGGRERLPW